jgi:hypothetical protein
MACPHQGVSIFIVGYDQGDFRLQRAGANPVEQVLERRASRACQDRQAHHISFVHDGILTISFVISNPARALFAPLSSMEKKIFGKSLS